ncbi:GAF domain-containing protein [Streptomyces coeruleoprunus]|uniref:GAF domain-containing protein n=1 Tax=Streptomyces coeruleoprunus TaxID=285563 RepID=A0ABV9XD29_9ACTN
MSVPEPQDPGDLAARVPRLLEAMRSVGTGPDLRSTLDRICATAAELTGARHAAVGLVGEADGFGEGSIEGRTSLAVPIRVRDEVFGTLCLTGKRGGGDFTEGDLHLVRVLATEAGVAIANARLYEEARQRERWIDGSVAVTTALLSGDLEDAAEALAVVAEQARRPADSAAGIVLLPTEDGTGLEVAAAVGDGPVPRPGLVVPADNPVAARLLAGEPVVVADAARDPRMPAALAEGYGPSMLLALRSDGRVVGVLATPRGPGARPFGEPERTLAEQFAAQAALALVMARTQRDRERLAVYEDRDRIARDLHDLVIQRLFATGMLLESARRESVVPAVREGVGRAVDALDVTIQEIRTAIFALEQDTAAAPSGLRTRVLREIGTVAAPLGFTPSHRFVGPVDAAVGELTGQNLIAALREALSNAFRHAGATRIEVVVDATVTLPNGAEGVRLTVADDGVGLPEGGRRSGLRNLARRAESLGGASWCEPGIGADGTGTTVVWQAPRR